MRQRGGGCWMRQRGGEWGWAEGDWGEGAGGGLFQGGEGVHESSSTCCCWCNAAASSVLSSSEHKRPSS